MPFPFASVPDADLTDLRRRLLSTRLSPTMGDADGARGMDRWVLLRLLRRWAEFDWRAKEADILALPWRLVGSGDATLSVVHQPASEPDAPVVVLLHGWPDSVLRFEKALPLMRDLHVVAPALPGHPFAAGGPGTDTRTIAGIVAGMMAELGHDRYVVSGGDVGADVAEHLADLAPDRVSALHLTNISPMHAVFADRTQLGPDDLAYLDLAARWQRAEGGYIVEQSSKPQTLAAGLADSPAGLAAWIGEKLLSWSGSPMPDEDMLTWISASWFTESIGSSFTTYASPVPPVPYVSTPTVLSTFAHDTKPAPREFAARYANVVEFRDHDRGGHFAAWEEPELWTADLRAAVATADS
ncbi:MAG: alpha/beta fold hydrolase [Gordonia paraffinivorans]